MNVEACWGSGDFGATRINATGRLGGLLNMWDNRVFTPSENITSRHFLITIGHQLDISEQIVFANIYAPLSIYVKEDLWYELTNINRIKGKFGLLWGTIMWCVDLKKRLNSIFCPCFVRDFNEFIHENGLIDLKMGGGTQIHMLLQS